MVKDAESLHVAPLVTRTKIISLSDNVSVFEANSELNVFEETPAVWAKPLTKNS